MNFKELCEKREKLLNDFERTFKFSFPVISCVIVDIERLTPAEEMKRVGLLTLVK